MSQFARNRADDDGVAFALFVIGGLAVSVILLAITEGLLARATLAFGAGLLLAVLSAANLKRVLLGLMVLEIPIQVDSYIGHDEAIAQAGALSGFNISVTTFCLVILYSLWLAEKVAGVPGTGSPQMKLTIPSWLYFGLVSVSVSVATEPLLAVSEIVILAQALLVFTYVLFNVKTRQDVIFVIVMLVIAMLLQSLLALSVLALGNLDAGPIAVGSAGRRLFGTFGSPVVLGGYLSLTLGPALGLMLTPTRTAYRWLAAVAFSIGSLTLVLTFTRGAWGGFLLTGAFMFMYALRRGWVSTATPALFAILALVIAFLLRDEIIARVAAFDNPSAKARFPLMDLAFRMIRDNPVLGVGANNFAATMNQYLTVDFSRDWIFTVHNKYLLVWAETGIASLVSFLWVIAAAMKRGWAAIAVNDRFLSPLALGLTAGIAANLIHMLVDIFHARPQTQMLWLVIGLTLAIWKMLLRDPSDRSEPRPVVVANRAS